MLLLVKTILFLGTIKSIRFVSIINLDYTDWLLLKGPLKQCKAVSLSPTLTSICTVHKNFCRETINNYLPWEWAYLLCALSQKPTLNLFCLCSLNRRDMFQTMSENGKAMWLFYFPSSRKVFAIFIPLPHTACSWNNMCIFLVVRTWLCNSFFLTLCILYIYKSKCSCMYKWIYLIFPSIMFCICIWMY